MQLWVQRHALDLYKALMLKINANSGCRATSEYMIELYNELKRRGKQLDFEHFMKERFPYVIEAVKPTIQVQAASEPSANIHHVFKSYNPRLLRFPQQLIIIDSDKSSLTTKVQKFVKGKSGVDSIIIDDRAYIEYFMPEYAPMIAKIPKESRDIYLYRKRSSTIKNNSKA